MFERGRLQGAGVAGMNQGKSYSVVLGSTGTDTIYCHVHNQPSGQFTITSQ